MQNPFEQLKTVSTSPPHDFEEAAWLVVEATEKNVRRIALSRGDGGIDAAQGTWTKDGEMQVFQFKYFTEKIGPSQKKQIIESFNTAKENPLINLKKWTLVLPSRLRKECLFWFENWKNEQDKEIEINLWDGDDLVKRLENPSCHKARSFLAAKGIIGLKGNSSSLEPLVHILRALKKGYGFVLQIALKNTGSLTVSNPRLEIKYTQTGFVDLIFPP